MIPKEKKKEKILYIARLPSASSHKASLSTEQCPFHMVPGAAPGPTQGHPPLLVGETTEKKNTRMKHLVLALVCNLHTHPWKVPATPFSHSWKPSKFGDITALRKAYDIHLGVKGVEKHIWVL